MNSTTGWVINFYRFCAAIVNAKMRHFPKIEIQPIISEKEYFDRIKYCVENVRSFSPREIKVEVKGCRRLHSSFHSWSAKVSWKWWNKCPRSGKIGRPSFHEKRSLHVNSYSPICDARFARAFFILDISLLLRNSFCSIILVRNASSAHNFHDPGIMPVSYAFIGFESLRPFFIWPVILSRSIPRSIHCQKPENTLVYSDFWKMTHFCIYYCRTKSS